MNTLSLKFLATLGTAFLLSLFLPWWSVMIAGLIAGLFLGLKGKAVFFIPFLSIALLWMSHAFWLGNVNDFVLARKIAILLPLGGSVFLLLLVTGIIGGLAAGISAIFGKQCRNAIN
jgi:hypothetical protein